MIIDYIEANFRREQEVLCHFISNDIVTSLYQAKSKIKSILISGFAII
jgi:hypothetical protein